MSLSILNINPINGSITIPMDQKITVQFSESIDSYTIANGINLYTSSSDGTDEFISTSLSYVVNDDTLVISPTVALLSEKTYFFSVFPGNDVARFISAKTTSNPVYERVATSTGLISIGSAYSGTKNGNYTLTFTSIDTFDLSLDIEYIGSFTLTGSTLDLGLLKISSVGTFDIGDIVTISVFKAEGMTSLYKITFTTNKYITILPTSQVVTDDSIEDYEYQFNIVNTIPDINSVNNLSCNPIIIKFNKDIRPDQDILNRINIKRTDIVTGRVKYLKYKYKIDKNILKIYLISG